MENQLSNPLRDFPAHQQACGIFQWYEDMQTVLRVKLWLADDANRPGNWKDVELLEKEQWQRFLIKEAKLRGNLAEYWDADEPVTQQTLMKRWLEEEDRQRLYERESAQRSDESIQANEDGDANADGEWFVLESH